MAQSLGFRSSCPVLTQHPCTLSPGDDKEQELSVNVLFQMIWANVWCGKDDIFWLNRFLGFVLIWASFLFPGETEQTSPSL